MKIKILIEFTGFLRFKTLYNIELISVQATGGPASGNLKLDEFFGLQVDGPITGGGGAHDLRGL